MKTLLSVCSARPNFVKLAAIHHAIVQRNDSSIRHIIVHTGQHYDPLLSDVFFTQLGIPQPDENLGVKGGDREAVLRATEEAIAPVLQRIQPDCVLVYGDVNGALGAARAAKKLGLKIAHIEAGLRSFDPSMPEELNRIEIDQLADLLLVTEQSGMENLRKEKTKGQAHLVGNTMIDTLIRMMPLIDAQAVNICDAEGRKIDRFAVATIHRPSNVDDLQALRAVLSFVEDISRRLPVVLPKHPRLAAAIANLGYAFPSSIIAGEPIGYLHFLALMKRSAFILTDSGGIQEEAVLLGKRCFTLRRNTERPVTIESGSNVLIDNADPHERQAVLDFAAHPRDPAITVPSLWDGRAGERIISLL